jgi:riboflavin synthase
MFTGIVQQLGEVTAVTPCDTGQSLHIDPRGWQTQLHPGDSVAVNGCCLTLTGPDGGEKLRFDVIHQTLRTTALGGLSVGDPVNLEPAVTAATYMSGHLVQGHVDGVGRVRSVSTQAGERRLRIEPPVALMECIVDKGSIALDGVSMTVASRGDTWFEVALIPTTIERTNLGGMCEGRQVNIEVDYVAKIVVGWLKQRSMPFR